MGKKEMLKISALICGLAMIALFVKPAAAEVSRMTKEELKALLGSSGITILDVRAGLDWEDSEWKIPGAIREDPRKEVKSWAEKYPKEKTLVLYCA
jgi:hypothetical protein